MKAIMTVIGADRVGIVANVSCLLADMSVNILDISQTIMEGIFTMTILVDTATSPHSFDEISAALSAKGEESGLSIRIQRRDLFTAMHRI
ncbi:MAG: ACT domain-containing protein [Ruminococcaceae bacterium]|nr:ACT domain-containing protein [Oscillospiraceae bacterium]